MFTNLSMVKERGFLCVCVGGVAVLDWWLGEVGFLFFFQSFLVLGFEGTPTPLFPKQNAVERKRALTSGDERWANRLN